MLNEDTKKLLDKMKECEGYVSVSDLAYRFEAIDELYRHKPWNLKQILNNIDIFIPIYIDTTFEILQKLKKDK